MWPRPSSEALRPALLWAGVGLVAFLIFRAILPPRPAAAPLVTAIGLTLVAGVLYNMRGRLFVRSAAFALAGVAAYLFAWNRGVPALYGFSAGCFAIVAVSHLLPRWALSKVEGRIAVPLWIIQGGIAEIRVAVTNPSASAVRMLELEVALDGSLTDEATARALLVQLAGGRTRELAMRTPPLRRGRHFAGPISMRTGFPLGLAFAEHSIEGSGEHIWVYPRLFSVEFVPVAGEQFLDMGDAISPRSGGVEEFAGVREYRHGDSRRHVHWRASARRGELVVKEFTRRAAATVTIAVDLSPASAAGEGIETPAEYAIRVAGSVARYALGQGHYVQLALCGAGFELLGPMRGLGSFEGVLRALALARTGGDLPFAAWLPRLLVAAPVDSTLVLAYADDGSGVPPGTQAFQRKSVLVVPVAIEAASFGSEARAGAGDAPRLRARARRVRKGHDLTQIFRQ